jgi:multicomponent Na+:H+ antiporter subunit A
MMAWGVLSQHPYTQSIAQEHTRLTPEAQAKDVVTAILADFRGLDTLGEIIVVLIALLGVMALLVGKGENP